MVQGIQGTTVILLDYQYGKYYKENGCANMTNITTEIPLLVALPSLYMLQLQVRCNFRVIKSYRKGYALHEYHYYQYDRTVYMQRSVLCIHGI